MVKSQKCKKIQQAHGAWQASFLWLWLVVWYGLKKGKNNFDF